MAVGGLIDNERIIVRSMVSLMNPRVMSIFLCMEYTKRERCHSLSGTNLIEYLSNHEYSQDIQDRSHEYWYPM